MTTDRMPVQPESIPHLIAHRGYAEKYPENSLLAMTHALECGACFLELDIQLSKDKVPVLLHDVNLKRVSGVSKSIHKLNVSELLSYSLSEPGRFGQTYAKNPFTLLVDLIQFIQNRPDITLLVDVKLASIEHFSIAEVLEAICNPLQVIRQQVIIISYDSEFLAAANKEAGFRIGYIVVRWQDTESQMLKDLAPELVICSYRKVPGKFVAFNNAAWDWALYEITDPELALALGRKGVKFIETMAIKSMFANDLLRSRACFG